MSRQQTRIGISGWTYGPWRGTFYPPKHPQKRELEFASRQVNSIEINGSFYSLQRPASWKAWHDETPEGFVFSVKGSRYLTHMLKLSRLDEPLSNFFAQGLLALEEKLGPILFQLPPRWKLNVERFAEFLEALPVEHKYVFEFRDESWFVPEVYRLLRKYNAAFCVHDFADMKVPNEVTAKFAYIRFHGPTSAKYWGEYSDTQLQAWTERIAAWPVTAVYAYFNNDPGGAAVINAMTLKTLVSKNANVQH